MNSVHISNLMIYSVVSRPNYNPFVMVMPDRNETSGDYWYGFNGMEKDDDIKDISGSSINYKYRMHDPRVGRFFAVDPLAASFPYNAQYNFSENRVIDGIELEGLEVVTLNGKEVGQMSAEQNAKFNEAYSDQLGFHLWPDDMVVLTSEDIDGKITQKITFYRPSIEFVDFDGVLAEQGIDPVVYDTKIKLGEESSYEDTRGFVTILMEDGPFDAIGGPGTGATLDAHYRKSENGIPLALTTVGNLITLGGLGSATTFGAKFLYGLSLSLGIDDMTSGTDALTVLDNLAIAMDMDPDVVSWLKTGNNLLNFTKSLGSIDMDQTIPEVVDLMNAAYQTATSAAAATTTGEEEVEN